jgi:GNAT superfamily N-acetyltransferase
VVVGAGGAVAAFVTGWLDPLLRLVELEPVGTHPVHRRQGLASAVMAWCMRKAYDLGARTALVATGYRAVANHLYDSLGFDLQDIEVRWQRDLLARR